MEYEDDTHNEWWKTVREEDRRGWEGEELCRSLLSYGRKFRRRIQKGALAQSK